MQQLLEFLANLSLDFPLDIIRGLSCLSQHLLSLLLSFLQTDLRQTREDRRKKKPKRFQDIILVWDLSLLLYKLITLDM